MEGVNRSWPDRNECSMVIMSCLTYGCTSESDTGFWLRDQDCEEVRTVWPFRIGWVAIYQRLHACSFSSNSEKGESVHVNKDGTGVGGEGERERRASRKRFRSLTVVAV